MKVIKFYADWCGPCRAMDRVWKDVTENIKDVQFETCNIDNDSNLAIKFDVQSIPAFIFIKNDEMVDFIFGTTTFDAIKAKIDQHK